MSQLSNNIYNNIKECNGVETLKTVRKLEKTLKKLSRYRNHLTFAIRCKTNQIQPKGLRLKYGLKTPKTRKIIETAEKKLLHEHINGILQTIRTLKKEIRRYEESLEAVLSTDVYKTLKKKLDLREQTEYKKVKSRQIRKFSRLAGFEHEDCRKESVTQTGGRDQDVIAPTEDASVITAEDQHDDVHGHPGNQTTFQGGHQPTETESAGSSALPEQHGGFSTTAEPSARDNRLPEERHRPSAAAPPGVPAPAFEPASTMAQTSQPTQSDRSAPDHSDDSERFKEKWVINLSEQTLSDAECSVLRKGLNFVPTPKHINSVDFITEVEKLITHNNMTQDEANKIRFEVTKALQSFKPPHDNLSPEERRALRHLREREDLMIMPSDKGRSVLWREFSCTVRISGVRSASVCFVIFSDDPSSAS